MLSRLFVLAICLLPELAIAQVNNCTLPSGKCQSSGFQAVNGGCYSFSDNSTPLCTSPGSGGGGYWVDAGDGAIATADGTVHIDGSGNFLWQGYEGGYIGTADTSVYTTMQPASLGYPQWESVVAGGPLILMQGFPQSDTNLGQVTLGWASLGDGGCVVVSAENGLSAPVSCLTDTGGMQLGIAPSGPPGWSEDGVGGNVTQSGNTTFTPTFYDYGANTTFTFPAQAPDGGPASWEMNSADYQMYMALEAFPGDDGQNGGLWQISSDLFAGQLTLYSDNIDTPVRMNLDLPMLGDGGCEFGLTDPDNGRIVYGCARETGQWHSGPATQLGDAVIAAQVCPNVQPDGGGCSTGGGGYFYPDGGASGQFGEPYPDGGSAYSVDPLGDVANAGSLTVPVALITSSGTVSAHSHVVEINATSGAITATLPVPTTDTGRRYVLKRVDSTASNAVAINTTSSTLHNSAGLVQANVNNLCSNLVIPTADLNTVAVWFYFASSSNADAVVFADNSVTFARSYSAYVSTSNTHLNFAYNTSGGVVDMGAISTSAWHQFVVTYDGTNATPYLDGVTAGPVVSPGPTNATPVCFGYDAQNINATWTGNITEAGTWTTNLSGTQVAALYAAGLVGGVYSSFSTPPTIYWPFFAFSGSQFPTAIGSSNYNLSTSGVVLSSNTPLSGNTLIDGLSSYPLSVGASVEMTSDGTEYRILGTGGSVPSTPWVLPQVIGGAFPSVAWSAPAAGHIAGRVAQNVSSATGCSLGTTTWTDGGFVVVATVDITSGTELCLVQIPCSAHYAAALRPCQPDAGVSFAAGDLLEESVSADGSGNSCTVLPTCTNDTPEGAYP